MPTSSTNIESLSDDEYNGLLKPVWNYLAPVETPLACDVIFVFGGLGIEIPRRAAELFKLGMAPLILISGGSGPLSADVFKKPESEVFRDELIRLGIPASSIITETHATNTGENVTFGMAALNNLSLNISSALLVSKAFIMRRCIATFAKQYPRINVTPCPPRGSPLDYLDRTRTAYAERLLAELTRLTQYSSSGFITPVNIPDHVSDSAAHISRLLQGA